MSDRLSALPADAVLVHVGPHKTGTSAIQSILANSRATLRKHGVDYPGRPLEQHHAAPVKALRQFADGWAHDASPAPAPAVWTRFVKHIGATPGRVVISSEFLAMADDAARAQVVKDLGPERVHVLAAARNPAAMAVSTWQQVLRKGYPVTLEGWLERFFRRSEVVEQQSGFWTFADPATLSSRWAELVGPERVTVVVLDERDRRLLPTTFEQLLDLPAGFLADQEAPQSNRGLTAVEAALIRRVITLLDSKLTWSQYGSVMRAGVIRRLLKVRRPGAEEPKDLLPAWAAEQAAVEAERSIAGLLSSGVRIVGDLDSLRVVAPSSAETAAISEVPLALAAEAVVGAISGATRGTWSLDAPARRPTQPQRRATNPAPARSIDTIPTRELAAALRQRVRTGLRRRFRSTRDR